MNIFMSFVFMLILSVGNFMPLFDDPIESLIIKIFIIISLSVFFIKFKFNNVFNSYVLLYTLFVTIFYFATSFTSIDLAYGLDKYISVSIVVLALYYIAFILNRRIGFLNFMRYIVLCGFFILIITILYKLVFGFWDRNVRFFLNGPIVFAWLMSFYALICIFLLRNTNKKIFLFLFFVFCTAVIWAESKGALIALLISLLFYVFQSSKFYLKISFSVMAVLLLLFNNAFFSWFETVAGDSRLGAIVRIFNGSAETRDEGSVTVRQDMLKESYNFFINDWVLGIGLGNYKFKTIYGFPYPHNIHMELFLECGAIVGIIYFVFIFYSFLNSVKIIQSLILLFFIAGSFSGDITYLRFLIFMCLMGVTLRTLKLSIK